MNAAVLVLILLGLCIWAVVHGGTRDPQPSPIWDDHDVSGLLEED